MNQITIDNILLVEFTKLGDQFKNIRVMPPDNKWTVHYLKYSYRSVYHTERFERDFYCGEEDPIEVPGNWQFIGTTDAITEEIAAKICAWFETEWESRTWRDYQSNEWDYPFSAALESYQSWLRANSINANIRYAILKLNP